MFSRTLKLIFGILFIPVSIASTKAFLQSLESLGFFDVNLYLLIGGFFAYPAFHIIFFKPMYIYAWGHEIVHVLATWLCGGKIISFHVSQEGGSITTTKNNLFISLSPYIVPIHAIFLILLYWFLFNFYDMSKFSNEFVFLAGFTMGFHLFTTVEVMKTKQPDIVKTGYLFSILFIYVANIFVLALALNILIKDISFFAFAKKTFVLSKEIYLNIFSRLFG